MPSPSTGQSTPKAEPKAEEPLVSDQGADDRRASRRETMVYRPVLVEIGGIVGFCLAKNISSSGMMGRFHTDCTPGAAVKIHFNENLSTSGAVAWCSDGHIGIRFDEEIDVPLLLLRLTQAGDDGKVSRAPRLKIAVQGHIVSNGRTVPVETKDISQKGLKLRSTYLQAGDEVNVDLKGLEVRKAVVKWARSGVAGLNFLRPLPFDQLGRWAIEQQCGEKFDPQAAQASRMGTHD